MRPSHILHIKANAHQTGALATVETENGVLVGGIQRIDIVITPDQLPTAIITARVSLDILALVQQIRIAPPEEYIPTGA